MQELAQRTEALHLMFDEKQLASWLADDYPSLRFRKGQNGRSGIWQEDHWWKSYQLQSSIRPGNDEPTAQALYDLSADDDNETAFGYLATGYSLVFEIKGRVFGGWIKDEIQKRDPRLWHNPGNLFHDAYRLSRQADKDLESRKKERRESGERTWEVVKSNDKLMNRIAKHMSRGDMLRAGRELSLEELYRNGTLENPKEMRSKEFKKFALGAAADKF